MNRFSRAGTAVLFGLMMLLSGITVVAQDGQAVCNWQYTRGYVVPQGSTMTLEECAATIYREFGQFGLAQGFGSWGDTGIRVDGDGNIYVAQFTSNGRLDWVLRGRIDPNSPRPRRPLTLDQIFRLAQVDINDFWTRNMAALGIEYEKPRVVLFNRSRQRTACGTIYDFFGPLYCLRDKTIYFPRAFMQQMLEILGDFAVVTAISHEWGHHIQLLANWNQDAPTIISELQADCFAGAYTGYATLESVKVLIEAGDLEEGVIALFLFGDPADVPWFDPLAHGTGEQRVQAFLNGVQFGSGVC